MATDLAPHSFEKNSTLSSFGCGMSQDNRFKYKQDDYVRFNQAPGPGNYELKSVFVKKQ